MSVVMRKIRDLFSTHSKREQWAWCMYDLAKSPFESVLVIFIGPYITYLARQQACITQGVGVCEWCEGYNQCLNIVYPNNSTLPVPCADYSCPDTHNSACCKTGQDITFAHTNIAYSAFFAYAVSASVILQILLLPLFGAVGDVYNPKKFLVGSTIAASAALFAFIGTNYPHLYWAAALLYIIANLCYGIANIFYNSMLVYISYPDERDTVSAHGFATGYIGALFYLLICFLMYWQDDSERMITYIVGVTGIWWTIMAMPTFLGVRSSVPKEAIGEETSLTPLKSQGGDMSVFKHAIMKIVSAVVILKKTPQTALFLVAAAIYNDGISTIGSMASVFATEVVNATSSDLLIAIFSLNVMAIFGALFFQ